MRPIPDSLEDKLNEVGIKARFDDEAMILLLIEILKELKKPSFG